MNEHVDCILGYFDVITSFLCHVCFNYTLIYLLSLGGIEGGVAYLGKPFEKLINELHESSKRMLTI